MSRISTPSLESLNPWASVRNSPTSQRQQPAAPPPDASESESDGQPPTIVRPKRLPAPQGPEGIELATDGLDHFGTMRSFGRPVQGVYFYQYNSSDDEATDGNDGPRDAGRRVFRQRDLNDLFAEQENKYLKDANEADAEKAAGQVKDHARGPVVPAPAMSADGGLRKAASRESRFREHLSMDNVSSEALEKILATAASKPVEKKDLTTVQRILYKHSPWFLRFVFLFFLASWWSLIPLMRASAQNFHPDKLPEIYSGTMIIVIAASLGVQIFYFYRHGSPWATKKTSRKLHKAASKNIDRDMEAGKAQMIETTTSGNKQQQKKGKGRRLEKYMFVVDVVLLLLALAMLFVSIVLSKHAGPHGNEADVKEAVLTAGAGGRNA
ncbi:hypothetical protein TWF696_001520 [Orbilia brochopaga]|uniref:Uncharacterized protein n=1 Tax=Orbilia brochopaga TaxID=3140254 RepID=A0AAV9U9S2_9PEZI